MKTWKGTKKGHGHHPGPGAREGEKRHFPGTHGTHVRVGEGQKNEMAGEETEMKTVKERPGLNIGN